MAKHELLELRINQDYQLNVEFIQFDNHKYCILFAVNSVHWVLVVVLITTVVKKDGCV